MNKVIWRDIAGYDGDYKVSNQGNVKSLKGGKEMIMRQYLSHNGYYQIRLSKNSIPKGHRMHRLIASAFIPNPLGKAEVNHIDGDKGNNSLGNLEWATRSENIVHAVKIGLRKTKKVAQICKKTKEILKVWPSAQEATRKLGISRNIPEVCTGKHKTCGGFIWRHYYRVPFAVSEPDSWEPRP